MNKKLNRAFDGIIADEALKESTLAYIQGQAKKAPPKKKTSPRRPALAAVCLLLALFGAGIGNALYFSPAAFVDVDVNPSIELTLNRFGRVLNANAYNGDGEVLLSTLQLRHKSYETALADLLAALGQEGYLQEDGLLSVTVQSNQKGQELLSSVQANIEEALGKHHIGMQREVYAVDADTKTHAYSWGVSPARYLAIAALQEVDPTATVEGCRTHTISELREYTQGHGAGHGSGNGNGHNSDPATEEPDSSETEEKGHHGKGGNNSGNGHGA